jgi:transposase
MSLFSCSKCDLIVQHVPQHLSKGQTDLVYQNGKFYLYATCDMPKDTPFETDDFLGVDLGEVNIAVDSTGKIFSNDKVEKVRLKYQKQRSHCQKKHEIK